MRTSLGSVEDWLWIRGLTKYQIDNDGNPRDWTQQTPGVMNVVEQKRLVGVCLMQNRSDSQENGVGRQECLQTWGEVQLHTPHVGFLR